MSDFRAVITGTGAYQPERVLSNDDLSKMVETSDAWIYPRTGIKTRRIAAVGENVSDMAAEAARRALSNAGVAPEEIELLVVGTVSGDRPFPATACYVQEKVGLANATCFDLSAACSGFIYSLDVVRQFILAGNVKKALVIGAEKMSAMVDWTDRTTCILFGDGAGAVVLERREGGDAGILASATGTDGSLAPLLFIEAGGTALPTSEQTLRERRGFVHMDGHTIFKHAVRTMSLVASEALSKAGLTPADVDWIVPHQANLRIISAVAKGLGIAEEKAIVNIENTGNTSGASIPLALASGVADGKIKSGDVVLFVAFGAGLTWGATVLRWA